MITLFYESNPAEAMAHDEALLNHSARHTLCLRGYQWQSAALTAGVFCSLSTPPSIPWARRITGGGLVLHGCDLTFTVVADDIPNRKAYALVGESLTRALNHLGIPAEVSGLESKVSGTYACFGAPVAGDVMVDGRKLAGYAMRRRMGRILMQGTLQMSSPEKQHIALVCPVEEYEDHSISINDLKQKLSAESVIERFALELETTFSIDVQYGMSDDIVLNTSLYLSNYENPELAPVRR